jgi:hypothetical protein
MTARVVVALIALATAGFVIGTTIERNSADSHAAESTAHVERESAEESPATESEARLLGVDIEAAPFVALAALGSLGLALLVWFRPEDTRLLNVVAVAMLLFAVLDLREVVHQADEDKAGLAVLAAVIAGLHVSAAAGAALMARRHTGPAGSAATMRG